jgi:hypothetical protein
MTQDPLTVLRAAANSLDVAHDLSLDDNHFAARQKLDEVATALRTLRASMEAAEPVMYHVSFNKGVSWTAYEFKFKPSLVSNPDVLVVPLYTHAQPVEQPHWQPIETAPKDGEQIMLSNGEVVAQGHWYYSAPFIREIRDIDGRYVDQDESDGYEGWMDAIGGMLPEPTHWMPLPTRPSNHRAIEQAIKGGAA